MVRVVRVVRVKKQTTGNTTEICLFITRDRGENFLSGPDDFENIP